MGDLPELLKLIENARKAVRGIDGKQIFAKGVCEQLHALAQFYFNEISGPFGEADVDEIFKELHVLSRKSPSRQKCLDLLTAAKAAAVKLEGNQLSEAATKSAGSPTPTDALIIQSLNDICPTASAAYTQALRDLASGERASWRGPATELREALRETLDILAPDAAVVKMEGFKFEGDAKRPTMKQKTKYILRNRDMNGGQIATSEAAVQAIEDMLGGITRSVYTRSSVSTHTPTNRNEVLRVHAWVRLVLCELLAVPLE